VAQLDNWPPTSLADWRSQQCNKIQMMLQLAANAELQEDGANLLQVILKAECSMSKVLLNISVNNQQICGTKRA
jgi:hypothetical protein